MRSRGLVGEERNAAILFLAITSQHLDKPVSVGVKGHSSSGKSFTVETVVRYFPEESVVEFTAMSERALVYSTRGAELGAFYTDVHASLPVQLVVLLLVVVLTKLLTITEYVPALAGCTFVKVSVSPVALVSTVLVLKYH